MKLFIVFMTVIFIVSTSCAVTEYQWPGPLVIPSDGTKAIESGSIRVQLPDNFTSVSRHVKVREGVEVTLDCSPIIKKFESNPLVRVSSPVTWSVKYYRSYSKTFGYKKIKNDSYGFIISGDKDSQLKITEVTFSSKAKLIVTENSSYTCEFCYDELNPISGTTLRTLCHNSTSRVQAIGEAPTINRNGELFDLFMRIGQTVYLNDYGSTIDHRVVVCEQNGTMINPIPHATILFNGEPVVNGLNFFLSSSNYGALVSVIPSFLASRNLTGNLTCILSNQFGSDTETTEIVFGASTKEIWKTGAWSECTQQCGGGRRQRSVTCVDSKTNEELSSSECNAFKPSENEPCNLQDCCFDVISLCSTVKSLCSYNKIKYMCCKTCSA